MSASPVTTQPRPEEGPLVEYRSIAPLAVVSVGLGIFAALILTTPLLAPLPVAGMVAAIAALRTIRGSRGELAGVGIAIVGLSLSTFFLGLGLARHVGRQAALEQRGREMADLFLNLLMDGKAREAHQFRQPPTARITAPEAIAEHYEKNKEAAQELQSFTSSMGVKELLVSGREADTRFESVSSATRDGQTDTLVLRYSFAPRSSPTERKPLWVHINRKYDEGSKRHQWEVGGIQDTPPIGAAE